MKKEIEVKAKVADLQILKSKLESLGCIFLQPLIQNDTTFVLSSYGPYERFNPGHNILRIREQNGKFLFTLKQPQKNELDCIEKETEINNPVELRGALELMGYHEAIKINKVRVKTKYKDMEICLDEVEGLGSFIEVEKLTEGDGEKIQNESFDFLETLGVKREDRVEHGYDTLIYLKNQK